MSENVQELSASMLTEVQERALVGIWVEMNHVLTKFVTVRWNECLFPTPHKACLTCHERSLTIISFVSVYIL